MRTPVISRYNAMGVSGLLPITIPPLAVLMGGLSFMAPSCSVGEEAKAGARDLIIEYAVAVDSRGIRASFETLTKGEHREAALAAFQDIVLRFDELPEYVHFARVMNAMLGSFGQDAVLPVLREALLKTDSKRVAQGLTDQGPYGSEWEWQLYECVATKARGEAMRDAAERILHSLSYSSTSLEGFEPSTALGFLYRGIAYLHEATRPRQPKPESLVHARADLSRAIALEPQLAAAYVERGRTLIELEECESALEDLTQALELDPRNATASELRALAYEKLGRKGEAQVDRETADRLRREERETYLRSPEGLAREIGCARRNAEYACYYRARGEDASSYVEQALDAIENILTYHEDQSTYYLRRAMFFRHLGEPAKALADVNEFLKRSPDAPYAYRLRATLHRDLGDRQAMGADLRLYEQRLASRPPLRPGLPGLPLSSDMPTFDEANIAEMITAGCDAQGSSKRAVAGIDALATYPAHVAIPALHYVFLNTDAPSGRRRIAARRLAGLADMNVDELRDYLLVCGTPREQVAAYSLQELSPFTHLVVVEIAEDRQTDELARKEARQLLQ